VIDTRFANEFEANAFYDVAIKRNLASCNVCRQLKYTLVNTTNGLTYVYPAVETRNSLASAVGELSLAEEAVSGRLMLFCNFWIFVQNGVFVP